MYVKYFAGNFYESHYQNLVTLLVNANEDTDCANSSDGVHLALVRVIDLAKVM